MTSSLHLAWRAIAHFLGEPVALPGDLDVETLAEAARLHRLEGALVEARLTPVSPRPHVPPALWERWQAAHAAGVAQAVRRAAPLKAALAAIAPAPAIILKGAALAELVYPSPGARGMGDIDVLVPADELEPALRSLRALGYSRKYPGHGVLDAASYHERQLQGPLELDLHQAFIQPSRLPIDYRAVFGRSIPWPALAPNARLLAPEDAVVYGCLHAAIGEFTPTWAPAIGLLDLRLLLRRKASFWADFGPALDVTLVSTRAREWGGERMVHVALALAQRVFPSLEIRKASPRLSLLTRKLLDLAIVERAFPPPLTEPSRPEVLARKSLLLRPAARIRFGVSALKMRAGRR